MPIPPYVAAMRELIGTREMWLPGVTAIVLRGTGGDAELLLTRRADNGRWAPITGILDPGEEPAVGAVREAWEETGVVIRVDRLASVGTSPSITYPNGDRAVYLDLTFACAWVSGEARVADDENLEVRWWPVGDLPPMSADLRGRIDDVLAGETGTRYVAPPS